MTDPISFTATDPQRIEKLAAQAEEQLNARSPDKVLGQDDFLRLLTVQLSQQDPMEPMSDTEYIAQMANFTSLEQMSELTESFSYSSASSLLGREVTVTSGAHGSQEVSGIVDAVSYGTGGPELHINGQTFGLADVQVVREAVAPNTGS